MKIVVLKGSPRPNGNYCRIMHWFLDSLQETIRLFTQYITHEIKTI